MTFAVIYYITVHWLIRLLLQLRLEFEANKVKETAMDAMFNER